MSIFHHTLVPLAGTDEDAELIRYAHLLHSLGIVSNVEFAHVTPEKENPSNPTSESPLVEQLQKQIQTYFPTSEDAPASSPSTPTCHLLCGSRTDALLDLAHQLQSDLILLGHRRHRSGQRNLARRLAMISHASIWLVPEGSPTRISRTLTPIDFSEASKHSLQIATQIAQKVPDCNLDALHVFSDPSVIRYDEQFETLQHHKQTELENFIQPFSDENKPITAQVIEGNKIAETILYVAQENQSDLIVVNTRGRSRSAAILLGSVTSQLMVESPIPILAVKTDQPPVKLWDVLGQASFWFRPNPHTN